MASNRFVGILSSEARFVVASQDLYAGLIGYQDEKDESSWKSLIILVPAKTRMKMSFLRFPVVFLAF